jgi:CARDB
MRHLPVLTLALALTAAAPAAPAVKRKPLATAKVVQCAKGLTPAARYAVFRGGARRVRGTKRMWIKFKLQERVGDGRFRAIAAPGLGVWRKSRSGVRRFAVYQRVLSLGEGASYRVVVQFRWYDADGELIRRARRVSPVCRQPGALPNLRVTRVGGRLVAGTVRYAVDVLNRGRAASSPTTVAFSVDGDVVDTPAIGALAPGETRRVFVNGPPCTGSVKAVVDPGDLVAEGNERDNTRTATCPTQ